MSHEGRCQGCEHQAQRLMHNHAQRQQPVAALVLVALTDGILRKQEINIERVGKREERYAKLLLVLRMLV